MEIPNKFKYTRDHEWVLVNGDEIICGITEFAQRELGDIVYVDIAKSPKLHVKQEFVIVPTVVVFKDGEEVKRFQADISFSMKATRKDMQGVIDELLMSDF